MSKFEMRMANWERARQIDAALWSEPRP